MTHDDLVEVGKRWLSKPWRNSGTGGHSGCGVIVAEMTCASRETPDVIGWHSGFTTLIECKTSRADFLADAKKHFRKHPETGLGYYRYYMVPKGLLDVDDLPDGWGLVEVTPDGKTRVKRASAPWYESNKAAEVNILLSLIRRLKVDSGRHVAINVYTIDNEKEPRASAIIGSES